MGDHGAQSHGPQAGSRAAEEGDFDCACLSRKARLLGNSRTGFFVLGEWVIKKVRENEASPRSGEIGNAQKDSWGWLALLACTFAVGSRWNFPGLGLCCKMRGLSESMLM